MFYRKNSGNDLPHFSGGEEIIWTGLVLRMRGQKIGACFITEAGNIA